MIIINYFRNFYDRYGILGILSAFAVFNKMLLFYYFVGPITNSVSVLVVSYALIYLLFSSIKNKWVPAGIYAAFSALMVCDVTYASFFGRYLSVNMLAAAAFLGDITASIMEVFKLHYLLLLVDAALIFACLIWEKVKKPKHEAGKGGARHKKKIIGLLLIAVFVANVTGNNYIKSVSNQEIFTYHVKDVAYKAFGVTAGDGLSAFKDTYADEKAGPLFGVAKGRNLIVIQLESFQNFVIGLKYNGQEITPNLNRLLEENTAYFDNYYQQIGSGNTSDAEFATNNSIYGSLMSYTYKLYGKQNYFRGLPVMLKEKGYDTAVFHAYENKDFWSREEVYPNLGFDKFYGGLTNRPGDGVYNMTEWMGWGLSDSYFYDQTADLMQQLKEPFYSFLISLSNHHPFKMLDQYQTIKLLPEDEGTILGNYLNSAAYTDYALGRFFEDLKSKGWYDNSVIAIYGDHVGLVHTDETDAAMARLLGRPYDYDDMMNIPLIISIPGAAKDIRQTIHTAGGQLDFFPTMAYLMGFDKLDTLYLGHNLFSIKEGLVAEQTYMTKGSYFKNDMAYEMARDGVFENGRAWNLTTRQEIPVSECLEDYKKSMDIVNTSEYILKSDAIRRVFIDKEDLSEAFNKDVSRTYPDVIAMAGAPGGPPGNSVNDMEASYGGDERCIRVVLNWNDASEPVAISEDTGEVEMTSDELIDWMEKHADTEVVASVERSGDYLIKFISEKSPAAAGRLILELPELAEYTGKYDAIINISNISQSADEIRSFVEQNHVWAIMMTKEESEGKFKSLMDLDTGIYITGGTDGLITKAN